MITAKVTSKGQITIPKKVRDKIGVSPGEEIQFDEKEGVFYIKKEVRISPFDRWVGYLGTETRRESDTLIEALRGK
jgi:AbrB family looped-hinge helix DNA binding protein